jgi:prephenate dehydratase
VNTKIAIQVIEGSNHYKVVKDFIQAKTTILPFMNFKDLVNAVIKSKVDYGIMAIENSIAGSILPNYTLISDYNLKITDEFYLDIKHNLVGLKAQTVADIKAVKSHQMAFLQCGSFFAKYNAINLIEDVDTALPAKRIAEENKKGIGALVPDGTAELFGLKVIKPHIQDNDLNSTRFVRIENKRHEHLEQDANKASIRFELEHEPGRLYNVLGLLDNHKINMTKIQSIPTSNSKWNYAFYIDMLFDSSIDINIVCNEIKKLAHSFKLLGVYKQAKI